MHKNILVTGASGQLGSEIRRLAAGARQNFLFTDVAELDITQRQAVENFIETNDIQMVINCAAYTNVEKAEEERALADRINHQAVEHLATACKARQATLVHISTDYIFDGTANVPYTENTPPAPIGEYGKTKLAGEQAIVASGCNYLIIRTSWLYSAFGSNFVKTMLRLTAEKDELKVVFDQAGTPTYAADLAQVILYITENNDFANKQGIYHFSNEGVCSWYDFAVEIRDLANNRCNIQPCLSDEFPSKVRRPHYSVLNKASIKSTFGIEIRHWKEALAECVKQIKSTN